MLHIVLFFVLIFKKRSITKKNAKSVCFFLTNNSRRRHLHQRQPNARRVKRVTTTTNRVSTNATSSNAKVISQAGPWIKYTHAITFVSPLTPLSPSLGSVWCTWLTYRRARTACVRRRRSTKKRVALARRWRLMLNARTRVASIAMRVCAANWPKISVALTVNFIFKIVFFSKKVFICIVLF